MFQQLAPLLSASHPFSTYDVLTDYLTVLFAIFFTAVRIELRTARKTDLYSLWVDRSTEITGCNNTSQQDFGTRKVYCLSNVTFHAESNSFCTMAFLIIDFSEFLVLSSVIFLYINKYFKWF